MSPAVVVQASEISRSPELKASHERLLAAWQAALPLIFPALKVHSLSVHWASPIKLPCVSAWQQSNDIGRVTLTWQAAGWSSTCSALVRCFGYSRPESLSGAAQESKVLEVMQAGDRRIVVLTQTHVALLRVRVAAVRSVYRAMWKVRLSKIQTVRGAPLHPRSPLAA